MLACVKRVGSRIVKIVFMSTNNADLKLRV